jgi:hypothetical protein
MGQENPGVEALVIVVPAEINQRVNQVISPSDNSIVKDTRLSVCVIVEHYVNSDGSDGVEVFSRMAEYGRQPGLIVSRTVIGTALVNTLRNVQRYPMGGRTLLCTNDVYDWCFDVRSHSLDITDGMGSAP